MPALPIKNVVECAFFLKFRKDWLEVPFEGFGKGYDLPAATANAERGAMVISGFVRAIGVLVGCEACKFSTLQGVHFVNVRAWHQAQCQEVDAENEAKRFHLC
jgi:hypothetical protein